MAKEACIGYDATKAVSLPVNHLIKLSASPLGFPIGMSSASTPTGCGVVALVFGYQRHVTPYMR